MTGHDPTAVKQCARMEFVPLALRKPYVDGGIAVDAGLGYRSDEHVIAEHVLAAEGICLRRLRIIIVHWTAECDTIIIANAGHCIYVRCHLIALAHCLTDHVRILGVEHPRLLVQRTVLRTVSSHYRAETAILKPSCVHLRINRITEVSSDIMAPISIKHIGSCSGEVWLEIKRLPRDGSVTRETDLIAMVAQASPTVVQKRTLVGVALHVGEVAVVDPPCIMELLHIDIIHMLLPIEPPEVNSLLLHRMHYVLEHGSHELLVRVHPIDTA